MKRSRLLALLLAAVLCIGSAPAAVFAEDEKGDPGSMAQDSSTFDFVDGKALDAFRKEAESLPSSYDLRHVPTENGEVSYVTSVKLQNPYGTCWGYATIAAAETSLLSSGLAAEYGYDVNTLDLSEKHLAYFATSHIEDPDDPQYGEGVHFRSVTDEEKKSYSYRYNTGGFTYFATSLFASGMGPVLEKMYDPETGKLVENVLAYKGSNGEVVYRESATKYGDDGKAVTSSYKLEPVWYSDHDDWSIPYEFRFYQTFRLKESVVLPSPAGWDENGGYVFDRDAVNAIKQQISKYHRGVAVSFCAESFLPGQDTSGKLYMSDNWAHFTNDFQLSNHMVTIIGYDDNYPKENFASNTENGGPAQPEGNGAFLVKNSWGSELNEFPNNGYRHWGLLDGMDRAPYDPAAKANAGNKASGYFWISYYDRSLTDPETFIFDRLTGDNGYYVDQYDYMNAYSLANVFDESNTIKMANVFTADATTTLREISVMTTTPGTKVSYSVYLLGDGFSSPENGMLLESGEAFFEYGGYHKIELYTKRILAKGQQFSVVIKETAENTDYVCIPFGYDSEDYNDYMKSVINKGESLYYCDAVWKDLSDNEALSKLTYDAPDYLRFDNFPIKAYLEPVTYADGMKEPVFEGYLSVNNWAEGNAGTFELEVGQSKTLTAEFRGISKLMPAYWDPSFEWVSADESVLKVSTSTPKKGSAVITGLKPGVTRLIVYSGTKKNSKTNRFDDEYGVRVLTIVVR